VSYLQAKFKGQCLHFTVTQTQTSAQEVKVRCAKATIRPINQHHGTFGETDWNNKLEPPLPTQIAIAKLFMETGG